MSQVIVQRDAVLGVHIVTNIASEATVLDVEEFIEELHEVTIDKVIAVHLNVDDEQQALQLLLNLAE